MTKFATLAVAIVTLSAQEVHAGGLYLPMRGVRPTGRGGAFVAGGDDLNSLWYNPAGLAALAGGDSTLEILVDAAYAGHSVSYTRVDSGNNVQPAVEDDAQPAPLPTLGIEVDLGKHLALAFGVVTPYSALDGYPEDGAQRYSLVSQHGSLIAIAELAVGWKVNDTLDLGVGLQNMFISLKSRVTFGTCPQEVLCAPEDPAFDALGEITANSWVTPSAIAGLRIHPSRSLVIGAALQLPFSLSTDGTVAVRLPSSGFFNGSSVQGNTAAVSTKLPAMARFGVEVAPTERLHIEVGFDWEMWSEVKDITVTPKNIQVVNAAGVGMYDLGPIVIPRNFNDTYTGRLGVEWNPSETLPLTLRGGYIYETGAPPPQYLSVLTVDGNKSVLTAGLGWRTGKWRFDATFAHVFVADQEVAPGTSCVPQVNPIRSGQGDVSTECVHDHSTDHVYVGDGSYSSSWNVFGLGMAVDY